MSERRGRFPADHAKPARQTKHRRVFEHVLAGIESGRLKEGERLPSESELVRQFATSRPTVARALRDLQNLCADGAVDYDVESPTEQDARATDREARIARWAGRSSCR